MKASIQKYWKLNIKRKIKNEGTVFSYLLKTYCRSFFFPVHLLRRVPFIQWTQLIPELNFVMFSLFLLKENRVALLTQTRLNPTASSFDITACLIDSCW